MDEYLHPKDISKLLQEYCAAHNKKYTDVFYYVIEIAYQRFNRPISKITRTELLQIMMELGVKR